MNHHRTHQTATTQISRTAPQHRLAARPMCSQDVDRARRILDAVYSPDQMAHFPPQRLLTEADAFEDERIRTRGLW